MSGVASSGVGVNINTTATGTGAQQTVAGLASVSAGIGQMAGVAVEGAQSLDGMARTIRGLGTQIIAVNPLLGVLTIGFAFLGEELLKFHEKANKLSLKKAQDEFKIAEEGAKSYVDKLKELDSTELKQHEESVKRIADYWKEVSSNIEAAKKAEDGIQAASAKYREEIRKDAMLTELANASPSEAVSIRKKYAQWNAVSLAEDAAEKALRAKDAAESEVHAKEGAIIGAQASAAYQGKWAQGAAQVAAEVDAELRKRNTIDAKGNSGGAITSDQTKNDARLKHLEGRNAQLEAADAAYRKVVENPLSGFIDQAKAQRELQSQLKKINFTPGDVRDLGELRAGDAGNKQAIADSRFTYNSALAEAKKSNDIGAVSAIEAGQERVRAAQEQVKASATAIGKFAEELPKLTQALESARSKLDNANIENAAAIIAPGNVKRDQQEQQKAESAIEASKAAISEASGKVTIASQQVSTDKAQLSKALGNMGHEIEAAGKNAGRDVSALIAKVEQAKINLSHGKNAADDARALAELSAATANAMALVSGSTRDALSSAAGALRKHDSDLQSIRNDLDALRNQSSR